MFAPLKKMLPTFVCVFHKSMKRLIKVLLVGNAFVLYVPMFVASKDAMFVAADGVSSPDIGTRTAVISFTRLVLFQFVPQFVTAKLQTIAEPFAPVMVTLVPPSQSVRTVLVNGCAKRLV